MSGHFDIFVIGAGVAGMKAAEEAVRRKLKVAIAEEGMFGGLVMNVNHLQPGPNGMPNSGGELAADMMTSVADLGVETLMAPVTSVERDGSGMIRVATSDETHTTRSVIVATGARLRKLGIAGEAEFEHRGVSSCADCDGPLFRNQTVVVIGGGDSAMQEAAVLTEYCSAVHVVHRGSAFSARKEFVDAVLANPRITVHFDTIAEAIEGDDAVQSVKLKNIKTGDVQTLPCTGVFAYVGLEPNTAFLSGKVATDNGAIRVNEQMQSDLPDVFAIGAARAGYAGKLTDAIADAERAVAAASERLARA